MNWIGGARARQQQQNNGAGLDTRRQGQSPFPQQSSNAAAARTANPLISPDSPQAPVPTRRVPYSTYDVASDPRYKLVTKKPDAARHRTLPLLNFVKEHFPNGDVLSLHLTHVMEIDQVQEPNVRTRGTIPTRTGTGFTRSELNRTGSRGDRTGADPAEDIRTSPEGSRLGTGGTRPQSGGNMTRSRSSAESGGTNEVPGLGGNRTETGSRGNGSRRSSTGSVSSITGVGDTMTMVGYGGNRTTPEGNRMGSEPESESSSSTESGDTRKTPGPDGNRTGSESVGTRSRRNNTESGSNSTESGDTVLRPRGSGGTKFGSWCTPTDSVKNGIEDEDGFRNIFLVSPKQLSPGDENSEYF